MGWGSGIVQGKEVGYLIEATCEHPDCEAKIDRGISYACGGFPGEDENSCAGFFCEAHLDFYLNDADEMSPQLCAKCGLRWERGEEGLTWVEEQEILDSVIETLFEDLRGHLKRHEYEKVDDFFRAVKIDDADDAILIALLKETADKKHVLPARQAFLTRVRAKVREHLSEFETSKLLEGL